MTENYSDDDDDAESIKASQFSIQDNRSMASLENLTRPETSTTYHLLLQPSQPPSPSPVVAYESVGVETDLYLPPQPVVIERRVPVVVPPSKPEVREISIQTDECFDGCACAPAPIRRCRWTRSCYSLHPPVAAPTTSPLSSIFREPPLASPTSSLGRRTGAQLANLRPNLNPRLNKSK